MYIFVQQLLFIFRYSEMIVKKFVFFYLLHWWKKRILLFNKMTLPLIIARNWILHCIYRANPSFGGHLKWLIRRWENASRAGKKTTEIIKISYIRMICREYCVPTNYTRGMYKMQLSRTSRLPRQTYIMCITCVHGERNTKSIKI